MAKANKARNEHAAALYARAGNAGTAIAVDTRPKVVVSRRRMNDRKSVRQRLKSSCFE
jgi:hypothetical protein